MHSTPQPRKQLLPQPLPHPPSHVSKHPPKHDFLHAVVHISLQELKQFEEQSDWFFPEELLLFPKHDMSHDPLQSAHFPTTPSSFSHDDNNTGPKAIPPKIGNTFFAANLKNSRLVRISLFLFPWLFITQLFYIMSY